MKLTTREIQASDLPLIMNYWFESSDEHLVGMGVDLSKMPSRESFQEMIEKQLSLPYQTKPAYATIWEINGIPCGHCNINGIEYGEHASMHLHLWENQNRNRGMGLALIKKSLPFFFNNFSLKKLICEPYALNPAPNKTMVKLGFDFIKKHHTTPGGINFPQDVNRYEMTKEKFKLI